MGNLTQGSRSSNPGLKLANAFGVFQTEPPRDSLLCAAAVCTQKLNRVVYGRQIRKLYVFVEMRWTRRLITGESIP